MVFKVVCTRHTLNSSSKKNIPSDHQNSLLYTQFLRIRHTLYFILYPNHPLAGPICQPHILSPSPSPPLSPGITLSLPIPPLLPPSLAPPPLPCALPAAEPRLAGGARAQRRGSCARPGPRSARQRPALSHGGLELRRLDLPPRPWRP